MKAKQKKKMISSMSFIFIILYGMVILYLALFSDRLGRVDIGTYQYNLVPFNEIRRFITYRQNMSAWVFILNICGNLLVFAPLGFLIPLWYPGKIHWYHIVIYCLSFSLCIELMQLYFRVGVFDVDDLIMNTTGGFIGWILYHIVHSLFRKGRRSRR